MLASCTEKPSGVHRSYRQIHTNMSGYFPHAWEKEVGCTEAEPAQYGCSGHHSSGPWEGANISHVRILSEEKSLSPFSITWRGTHPALDTRLHWLHFSLFSQSQPLLLFSHRADSSCLPMHLPSLLAKSFIHLHWIFQPPCHCFSLRLPPWLAEHPYLIRQLSPPYYCGIRKTCPGELQSILFSFPAAVQNSSRHCHRRCFPAHHKHRCFGGMESAHEDIARAESWPVRKVSSGGLNFKKTCKFLPGKFCKMHISHYL